MRILVGYDGSRTADAALKLGVKHAGVYNAALDIVHSLSRGDDSGQVEIDRAEASLANVKQSLEKKQIDGDTHLLIRGLTPGEDLVRFAKDNAVSEIIIGVRRRSRVGKLVFGSNAQYVILNAPCPVVTVK